ncbi:HEPN-associated N-terminal domain-containing protein [Longivirga aurantiaca]|uniref:HEPN-associated N-terminal domain-containing protein n=1 Tax=Longivirga aurantiaca TaxID=1837743 RepID=A0ABW1T0I8_9ACTN
MGLTKRYAEAIEARGYRDTDGIVCSRCLSEPWLVAFVRSEGGQDACSFCGLSPQSPDASAPLERVVQLIVEGLRYEYEDPAQGAGFDGREGGYRVTTFDTYDLLDDFEITEQQGVLEAILWAISDELWCQKDPYAAMPAEALRWGWQAFRDYVKHQRRYTFLTLDDSTADGAGSIPMHAVPAAVVAAANEVGLTKRLPAGTTWWRARVHGPGDRHDDAASLGSPPDSIARDNRMSPKGIGAFYGASTDEGAHREVAGYSGPTDEATVGMFTQLTDLSVVDLRDLPEVPSLFDPARRHLRGPVEFLLDFVKDVTEVASPDDRQNLEYIPTQVIAEHLRYDLPVDGILWRSSRDRDADVAVFFLTSAAMCDAGSCDANSRLRLEPGTIRRLPAPL